MKTKLPYTLTQFLAAAAVFFAAQAAAQTVLVEEGWQTDPLLSNGFSVSSTEFPGWSFVSTCKARNENQSSDVPGDTTVTDSHGYNQVIQLEGTTAEMYYDTSHLWATTDVYYLKVEAAPMTWTGINQRYIRPEIRLPDDTVLWTTANDATTAVPVLPVSGGTTGQNLYGPLPDYPSELTFFFEIDASTFPTDNGDESNDYVGQNLRLSIGQGNANRGLYINKVSLLMDLPTDNTPPTPDPLTWDTVPETVDFTSATMTVDSAFDDLYHVEYYFENTVRGTNSGWQDSRTWTETGLDYNTLYTYRVKARDTSPNLNESTTWTSSEDVTTPPQDLTPPSPDPVLWDTVPTVADYRSITMSAQAVTDVSGFEYNFYNVTNATESGWQDSRFWTQKDLDGDTTYTYEVRARDKSLDQNVSTTASAQESATTPAEPEGTLYITRFQDPLFSDNQGNPDLGIWQLLRGESVKTQKATGDGVRTDTDLSTPGDNYAIQLEWDDAELEIDIDHNWSASDTFTLTLNASPQNWSGENQRYIRPSLKEQDGTVLWAPGENMAGDEKTALPLYSTLVGASYQDDPNLTFTFEIDASTFSGAGVLEGEPIALRIDHSGQRGIMIDNVHLSVTTGGGGGTDFATWLSGYTLLDSSFAGDDDGDGLGNGLEGLFGTAPDTFDAGLAEFAKSGSTVTFTHPNPETPLTDLAGSYEWSLDLSNWNDSGDTVSGTTVNIVASPDDPESGTTTVTCTIPDTVPDQFYVRAVATQN